LASRSLGPYRQRAEREARASGLPIVRPLWMSDPRLGDVSDAFTLGADVLVAPAFAPGAARTQVNLPPGRWKHVWSGRAYRGARVGSVDFPLGRPAVLVRMPSSSAATIGRAARG
jgi:alpha-glucosidase